MAMMWCLAATSIGLLMSIGRGMASEQVGYLCGSLSRPLRLFSMPARDSTVYQHDAYVMIWSSP